MKIRLTKRAIDGATYQGPGTDYRWDASIAGFGLRVYPSGRKSFVVTYRVRGKQRFFTLGRYGELTLEEAQRRAAWAIERLVRNAPRRLLYQLAPPPVRAIRAAELARSPTAVLSSFVPTPLNAVLTLVRFAARGLDRGGGRGL